MSIFPLPVFEADADPSYRDAMSDVEIYERLKPPKTIVVRFGAMKYVAEFAYDGDAKPGCGSKLVARTYRGTEVVTMLTTTCANSGCSKSVTRQEMLQYIENSGGSDYPFYEDGRILRVATVEDLNRQGELDGRKAAMTRQCRTMAAAHGLTMKIVDAEPILGGELLTFYYMAEHRVDFRELVRDLAAEFKSRIEMRQVGARDEARLVADYERCGQHCCCKNFLKVLKPVSMRSAKTQKATLDPLKISGRCGRLMCCLRYEDQTYEELKAKLPRKGKRVGTTEGPGMVVDTKILVQLALVKLEHNQQEIAVPIEELLDPETCPKPKTAAELADRRVEESDPLRGMSEEQVRARTDDGRRGERQPRREDRPRPSRQQQQDKFRARSKETEAKGRPQPDVQPPTDPSSQAVPPDSAEQGEGKRRRRRRRRRNHGGSDQGGPPSAPPQS